MSEVLSSAKIGEQHMELVSASTIDEQKTELLPARNTMDGGLGGGLMGGGGLPLGLDKLLGLLKSDRTLKREINPVEWTR